MRAIIEESTPDISRAMQMLSLTEGAFLKHLHMALLSTGRDLRVLTNKQLSGYLIALWISENSAAMELLRRSIVCFISACTIYRPIYLASWIVGLFGIHG